MKQFFSTLFIILIAIGSFYLGQKSTTLPFFSSTPDEPVVRNTTVKDVPLQNGSTAAEQNPNASWQKAQLADMTFQYPTAWHVAFYPDFDITDENKAIKPGLNILINNSPNLVNPGEGFGSKYVIEQFNGFDNPEGVFIKHVSEFSASLTEPKEEKIQSEIFGEIVHLSGTTRDNFTRPATPAEGYFFIARNNNYTPQEDKESISVFKSILYDPKGTDSQQLRSIIESVKECKQPTCTSILEE